MQDENKPYYPMSSFSAYPYLVPNLADQNSDYSFMEQPTSLSSPPEPSLISMQDQIDKINMNIIASGLYLSGQATSPASAPLFDPMMGLYLQNAVPLLSGQYLGHPSSPLQEPILSDYLHDASSPTSHSTSPPSTAISPVLAPLPKPVSKSSPVKSSSHSSHSAKRIRESTVADDDFSNDPIIPGEDMAARKRRQNTLAARRSRQRKADRMEDLERKVSDLEKDKIQLQTRLAVMESEKENAIQRNQDSLERIRILEAQLLEAYKSRS